MLKKELKSILYNFFFPENPRGQVQMETQTEETGEEANLLVDF